MKDSVLSFVIMVGLIMIYLLGLLLMVDSIWLRLGIRFLEGWSVGLVCRDMGRRMAGRIEE